LLTRRRSAILLAVVLVAVVALARSHALPWGTPVASLAGFNAGGSIQQGNRFDCRDFPSQAAAQAVLRADPRDPNHLDGDRNGIACERNPAPSDTVPVPR
jgi:hypothetical protein